MRQLQIPEQLAENITPEAAQILKRAVDKVLRYPATFDMADWAYRVLPDKEHPCGTVACLAGQIVLVERPGVLAGQRYMSDVAIECTAKEILDCYLDYSVLFFTNNWPHPFKGRYHNARNDKDRVEALRDRVEHFLATEE